MVTEQSEAATIPEGLHHWKREEAGKVLPVEPPERAQQAGSAV